jgi:hypothetical protein
MPDISDQYWALRLRREDFGRLTLDRSAVDAALQRAAERVRRDGPGDGR